MTTKLKLVVDNHVKNRHSPRPVKVYYQGGSIGHCKTVRAALANATRHMLNGGIVKANVTYEDVPVADIERHGQAIKMTWKRYALNIGIEE
jgi:hypothetical protein